MKLHYTFNLETKTPQLMFMSNWGEIQYESDINQYLTTLLIERKYSFFLDNLNFEKVIVKKYNHMFAYSLFYTVEYEYTI